MYKIEKRTIILASTIYLGDLQMAGFKALKGQGDAKTLFASFLYFDFSFMVWTMLGPLATEISESLALHGFIMSASQKATLLSVPILAGALLRILLGFGVDKFGPKKTALMAQSVVIFVLFYAFLRDEHITYNELLLVATGLGFAGASFAVALPQAGQWYPPKLQGIVLGIAGAGNIGVVIDFLFAPKIAEIWGWQAVFLIGGILSTLIFVSYIFLAKDAPKEVYMPRPKKLKDYAKLLRDKDTWWFNFFYAVSFGGFAGAVLRPVGGAVANKMGGIKSLYIFFGVVTILALVNALITLPFWLAIVVLFFIMANLGMANGAVFQLVPQRFGKDIGIMTGIIGVAGGLGGTALIKNTRLE